jgi:RHS repeat-associated protein
MDIPRRSCRAIRWQVFGGSLQMRLTKSLRTWVINSFDKGIVDVQRSRKGAKRRLAEAALAAIEPLEKRTMMAATPLYWDPTGAATASGGTGTWNTTTAEWRSGSPTGSLVAWSNSGDANGPYQAIFSAGSGTVTTATAITAAGLSFESSGYTVSGSYNIVLAGSGQIDVASGDSATVATALGGSVGFDKTSAGTLTLSGGNYFTGIANVSSGVVGVYGNQSNANGGWSIGVSNAASATAYFFSGSTIVVGSGKSIQLGNNSANPGASSAVLNVAGTVTDNGSLYDGRAGNLSLNSGGVWNQNGSFSINGQGGYGSSLTVNSGASFSYSSSSAIAINAGNGDNAAGGSVLNISGGTLTTETGFQETAGTSGATANLILSNSGVIKLSSNVTSLVSGSGTVQLTNGGGTINTNGNNITLARAISGAGALTKTGAGVLTMPSASTYSGGTNISTGAILAQNSAALGSGAVTISNGGTSTASLQLSGSIAITNSFGSFASETGGDTPTIESISGNNSISSSLTIASTGGNGVILQSDAGTLTLSGNLTTSLTSSRRFYFQGSGNGVVSGNITDDSSHILSVVKSGSGIWTFGGNNTYADGTNVSSGTLAVNNTVGSGTGTGSVTVNSGAVLSGTGTISGPITINSGGILAPGPSGTGTGTLTTGTLTLASGSSLDVTINNFSSGTMYDKVLANGTVTLNSGTFVATGSVVNNSADQLSIISSNAGAIQGTFSDVAEGAAVTVNGVGFVATYQLGNNFSLINGSSSPTASLTGPLLVNNQQWITLNTAHYLGNVDANGNPVQDNQPDYSTGTPLYRIRVGDGPFDPNLAALNLSLTGAGPGTYTISFSEDLAVWNISTPLSPFMVTSGQSYSVDVPAGGMQIPLMVGGMFAGTPDVTVSYAPHSGGTPITASAQFNVVGVLVYVDADNNIGFADPTQLTSSQLQLDGALKDDPDSTGKIITADTQLLPDGTPYYAAGYDLPGVADDAAPADDRFVPVVVGISQPTDFSQATVTFNYSGSDPMAASLSAPAAGYMRLWLKDGDQQRNGNDVNDGGDYIVPGEAYSLAALGFSGDDSSQSATLYIEGIRPVGASDDADREITMTLDPSPGTDGDQDVIKPARFNVTIVAPTPTVPTNLAANVSGTNIDLTWADAADDETGFDLQRSTGTLFQADVTDIDSGLTWQDFLATDTSAVPGVTYYYRIAAINDGVLSAYSSPVPATIPSGLNVTGGSSFSATEGQLTGPVTLAHFTDAYGNANSTYTASIIWGDGQTSFGSIISDGNGGWYVSGSNIYSSAGTLQVNISITSSDGESASVSTTANVAGSTPSIFIVNSLADDGSGGTDGIVTLRWAIQQANAAGGDQTIEFAPSLTADGPAAIHLDGTALELDDTSGTITIDGPGANLLSISGILEIAENTTLDANGSVNLADLTVNNSGTLDWVSDDIDLSGGSTINNLTGATFKVELDSDEIDNTDNSDVEINNYGTLVVENGENNPTINVPLNNTGAIQVLSGSLQLNDGGISSGTFMVAAVSSLELNNGTFTLNSAAISGAGPTVIGNSSTIVNINGTVTAQNLEMTGGTISAGDDGTLTIATSMLWTGGTISGTLDVASGATLNVSSGVYNQPTLSGLTLNNAGTLIWTGSYTLGFSDGSTINNLSGATFDIEAGGNIQNTDNSTEAEAINNLGTLVVDDGEYNSAFIYAPLNNTGTFHVISGFIQLDDGGTSTGTFTADPGSTLNFYQGTFDLNSAVLDGTGLALVSSGDSPLIVNVNGNVTAQNLEVDGGATSTGNDSTLTVQNLNVEGGTISTANSGTLDISSTGVWTSGTISGTLNVAESALLTFDGPANLSSLTLNNAGTLNWIDGDIDAQDGSTINNENGATFQISCDNTIGSQDDNDSSSFVINNEGTIVKEASAVGSAALITVGVDGSSAQVNNSGTILADGNLSIGADLNNTGTIETNGGGVAEQGMLVNDGLISTQNGNFYYETGTTYDSKGNGNARSYTNNGTIQLSNSGSFYPNFTDDWHPGQRIGGSAGGLDSDEVGVDWEGLGNSPDIEVSSDAGASFSPYSSQVGYDNIITVGGLNPSQTRSFQVTSGNTGQGGGNGKLVFNTGVVGTITITKTFEPRVLLGFVDGNGNWVIEFQPVITVYASTEKVALIKLFATNTELHNKLAPYGTPDLNGSDINLYGADDNGTLFSDFSFDEGVDPNPDPQQISEPLVARPAFEFPTIDLGASPTSQPYFSNLLYAVWASLTSPTTPQGGGDPVAYGSGAPELTQTDLASTGFSGDWSVTRNYTTQTEFTDNTTFGNGWMDASQSFIQDLDGGALNPDILVVSSASTQTQFDYSGDSYAPASVSTNSLTYDSATDLYTLLDASTGSQYIYYGFGTSNSILQGKLDYYEDAGGNTTLLNYDTATGDLDRVTQTDSEGDVGTFLYSYDSNEQVSVVKQLLQRSGATQPTIVRQAVYSYYDGSYSGDNAYGNAGDLKTVTIEDGSGNMLDESYYRYYTADTSTGFMDGLEYVFSSDNVAKMAAALGSDFESASNSTVVPYADEYFQYNSDEQVTEEVVGALGTTSQGGEGTYTFSYQTNQNFPSDAFDIDITDLPGGSATPPGLYTPDFNAWYTCTTETMPNGNQNTVYTNIEGSELLFITTDNQDPDTANIGNQWITAYQYNSFGMPTMTINPSAINTSYYNLSSPDFENDLHLGIVPGEGVLTSTGLVNVTTYNSTEYPSADFVEQGWNSATSPLNSDAMEQDSFDYTTDPENDPMYFLADSWVYRNGVGSETTYSYTWQGSSLQPASIQTSLPVDSADQSGSDVSTTVYDSFGNAVWTQDAGGYITYNGYDIATGAIIQTVTDVNTADMPVLYNDIIPLPTGWTTPTGGGLNLDTLYQVDDLGRTTQEISPAGNVTDTVYDDVDHAVFTFPGVSETLNSSGNGTLTTTGPITMNRSQIPYLYTLNGSTFAGIYDETLTYSGSVTVQNNQIVLPGFIPGDGVESSSGNPNNVLNLTGNASPQYLIQSLSRNLYNSSSQLVAQLVETDTYASINNATYLATPQYDPYSGTAVTGSPNPTGNYYSEYFGYLNAGENLALSRVKDADGTITDVVPDGLGRAWQTWIGTDDATTNGLPFNGSNAATGNNMTLVSVNVYDNGDPGDGNLTQTMQYPGGAGTTRITQYFYNWQDQPMVEVDGAGTSSAIIYYDTYDNLGEVTDEQQYAGSGVGIAITDGVPTAPPAADLRAQETIEYDGQGQVYQTNVFSVQPLTSSDPGQVGAVATTNTFYDSRGDVMAVQSPDGLWTKDFYDGADRLVEQAETNGAGGSSASAAGSIAGDVVFSQMLYAYDGDDNLVETVEADRLSTDSPTAVGSLAFGGATAARVSYSASYYDAADRDIADVNVGTNGGSVWTRPSSVPTRSSSVLEATYVYDPAGNLSFETDPKGIITAYGYDALGRMTVEVENWNLDTFTGPVATASWPAPTDSANQTTTYEYDGNNNVISVTAVMPSGEASQTTDYIYGVSTAQGSLIDDNDLLYQVHYPDPTTGDASSSQAETYTYDALSDQLTYTDRNATTHAYSYDSLGRLTADNITHFASGVDQTVSKIGYTYDDAGNMATATSYNASGGVVNQVVDQYDGFGQLATEYQAVSGAVDTSITPSVQYGYDTTTGDRITSMTYPNGRTINYNYNGSSGLDSTASRITSISDSDGSLIQSYQYQGLDTPMVATSGNGVVGTTTLDSVGRISSLIYTNSSGGVIDGYGYTYDNDGNVLSKTNLALPTDSETYTYDGLNRLTSFARGTVSSGTIASPTTSESWNLNAIGDWNSETVNGVTTSWTNSAQNQAKMIGSATLNYDADGNTLTNQVTGQTYGYDAWNRLVTVKNSSGTVIASYTYDALGRRITQTYGTTTTDLYYSSAGQVIEAQQGGVTVAQYVWSPFYVNQLVQETNSHGTFYVQQDANYNVTSISNSSGSIVERYVYDPYGQVTVLTATGVVLGTGMTSSAYGQIVGFQGGWTDLITGFVHFNARDLDPWTGQWNTQDPTGAVYVNGPNLGQLEYSNPSSNVDPTGMWSLSKWALTGDGNASDSDYNAAAQSFNESNWDRTNGTIDAIQDRIPGAVGGAIESSGVPGASYVAPYVSKWVQQTMPQLSSDFTFDQANRDAARNRAGQIIDVDSKLIMLAAIFDGMFEDPAETPGEEKPCNTNCFVAGTQVLMAPDDESSQAGWSEWMRAHRWQISGIGLAVMGMAGTYLVLAPRKKKDNVAADTTEDPTEDELEPVWMPLMPAAWRGHYLLSLRRLNEVTISPAHLIKPLDCWM